MNPLKRRITVGLFAVALAAAACGSSSTSTSAKPARGFTAHPGAPKFVLLTCPEDNLQDALNAAQPGEGITVQGTCTGSFTIKSTDLTLGGGFFLDGGGTGTVLTVNAGASATLGQITIQHGSPPSPDNGGGIFNSGTLTLKLTEVKDNQAGNGGGIDNHGTLKLKQAFVHDNMTFGAGGGIYNLGTADLDQSSVTGNTTAGVTNGGGGILNDGQLTLGDSPVSGNHSDTDGGGIFNSPGGTVTLSFTQVNNNTSGRNSGGMINYGTAKQHGSSSITDNHPNNCAGPNPIPGCSG
jgi:hypothetical protein